ncbi:hypothetical protein [Actinomadura macrotermitis]|uniref:hypothetical protein n=1 Tax=Actinomadura macrotermitis TaxID=2585200 RepID=UPI001296088E|nr:hypothetical protein [Actinomadura macrotermitis]
MTKAPAKHARGRHARKAPGRTAGWTRLAARAASRAASVRARRRRLVMAGTGSAVVALLAVTAVAGLAEGGDRQAPSAAVAARSARTGASATPGAPAVQQDAARPADPDEVGDALPYLRQKDPAQEVVKHVTDVRRSGDFLRVYTDLGEDEENSPPAVSLCEWTTQYLKDGGDTAPRVFVHGRSSDNGSVVLANKQSDDDDCKVEETR